MDLCAVPDCNRSRYGYGYCGAHYRRWKKYGDPLKSGRALNGQRPLCSVQGCERAACSRGWCKMHYSRWKKHGDPLAGRTFDGEQQNYIETVALPFLSNDCLRWPFGFRNKYPRIWTAKYGPVGVHQYICQAVNGPRPNPEYHAAHNCGNKWCVNPAHVRWATPAENNADKIIHGTAQRGERHPNARLRKEDVIEIRLSAKSDALLARKFDVTVQCINQIRSGKSWHHLLLGESDA